MDKSSLNRLVVVSIPTASTKSPFTINALSTTNRARKEQRQSSVVGFVVSYLVPLVILWSYLESGKPVNPSKTISILPDIRRGIRQGSTIMNFVEFLPSSPYILLSLYFKEPPHETHHCCLRSLARSCRSRSLRPRPTHRSKSESSPCLPPQTAKLHFGHPQALIRVSSGGIL
jgi:hypothetical protein